MSTQTEYKRDSVEFMRIGYNDACINFLIDFHRSDFDILKKAVLVAVADGYNEFDPKKFVKSFSSIEDKLYKTKFGREGSPACYLTLKHDATAEDVAAVKAAFKSTKPDKVDEVTDTMSNRCKTIRVWWD